MQQVRRQKMWAFLKEPAAQLRGLKISIPELQHQVLHSCLFADDAPQLRRFDVLSTPYKFPTNASDLYKGGSADGTAGNASTGFLTAYVNGTRELLLDSEGRRPR
ncbi:hypothetical protein D9613_010821 [Agrocybe pediades]|uniref:Uncharacterized protein n=1 Tax=Agrocybe pediades TaxID=84607 RepID=A0A8H4QL81_9AGAR|nr:hypothetical protein D9613_010821 [Agrocybe pediades]